MTKVWFAAFSKNGTWRVEETTQVAFDWARSLDPNDRGYFRIYKLRTGRDSYEAIYRLFRVMRDRYGVEPL